MKEEIKNRLEKTVREYLYAWEVRHGHYPDYLWHYTNISGVRGLLSEGKLWFSDAAFLNDSTELSYAVDLCEEVITNRIHHANVDPLVKEYLESFVLKITGDRKNRQAFGFTNPAFVACFCEEGDSLHLWRAYTGNGRGYSIGFFPDGISRHLKPLLVTEQIFVTRGGDAVPHAKCDRRLYKPALRQVIYEVTEQKELLNTVVDSFSEIIVANRADFPSGNLNNWTKLIFVSTLYSVFYEYLSCFKHPTFKEEKEWRFIYSPDLSRDDEKQPDLFTTEIEYRDSGGYMVPYLKVDISEAVASTKDEIVKTGEAATALTLPFEAIISGPGLDANLATASLNSFILRKGYLGTLIYIEHSSVPLRTYDV
jgi:hypothetical protein